MGSHVRTLLPDEIWGVMHGKDKAKAYDVIELDMTNARSEVRFAFQGNSVALMYISAVGTPVRIRLNRRDAKSIPFYTPGSITRAFDCIFVSHDAAPGVKAVLYLDWDLRT